MDALFAAVVLAWFALVLLTFAMAGMRRQLRDVQAALGRLQMLSGSGPPVGRELPEGAKPQHGRGYAAILLVDNECPVCLETAPAFAKLAPSDQIDAVLLSRKPASKFEDLDGVRRMVDPDAYQLLDPGWQPALVIVDAEGAIIAAEPTGSEDSILAALRMVPS